MSSIPQLLFNLLVILVAAYGIGLTALLILRWLVGESWQMIAFVNNFLHLLLLLAIVLFGGAVLLRRWHVVLTLALPTLLFLFTYGGQFIPRSVAQADEGRQFTLMTFNVTKNLWYADDIIDIVREADADIVLFQEINPYIAHQLERAIGYKYPYQAMHPTFDFKGQGILSRFPIVADDYWRRTMGHQRAQVNIDGVVVTIYNTHPVHPFRSDSEFFDPEARTRELTEVLGFAAEDSDTPLILAGDFNMTDLTEDYARVASTYTDTYREAGWGLGFTFPSLYRLGIITPSVARIDYVFHSDDFRASSARVWPTAGGSDHRALYTTLTLKNTEVEK